MLATRQPCSTPPPRRPGHRYTSRDTHWNKPGCSVALWPTVCNVQPYPPTSTGSASALATLANVRGASQSASGSRRGTSTRYMISRCPLCTYLPPSDHSIPPHPTFSFISLPLFRPHIRGRLDVRTNISSPRFRSFMDRGRPIETCMFPHEHSAVRLFIFPSSLSSPGRNPAFPSSRLLPHA